jgi:hypothetical protein
MGALIRDLDDVLWALETVRSEGRIFLFFAFDNRPSHSAVLDFLASSSGWIDSLSASTGVFSLVFAHWWTSIEWDTTERLFWLDEERP